MIFEFWGECGVRKYSGKKDESKRSVKLLQYEFTDWKVGGNNHP